MPGKMKILAGNSNRPLAEAIAAYLGEPLTACHVRRFADLEIFVEILENVRGRDAFIIQSTSYPANDNLMELLIMIDALRRASAQRITAVIPYFGYARQDRKSGLALADLGQARRQSHHPRRRRPGADRRSARRPDPGLFRYPDRQSVRRADHGARHQGPSQRQQERDGRFARCRRRGARPRARQAPRRAARHRRQAARAGGQIGSDEHHRRRGGAPLRAARRYRQFRRHSVQRRRRPAGRRARRASRPISPTACCRAGRWRASPRRSSANWC